MRKFLIGMVAAPLLLFLVLLVQVILDPPPQGTSGRAAQEFCERAIADAAPGTERRIVRQACDELQRQQR